MTPCFDYSLKLSARQDQDDGERGINAPRKILLEPFLTQERYEALFAWIFCALQSESGEEEEYNLYGNANLVLRGIFGSPNDSPLFLQDMISVALDRLEQHLQSTQCIGPPLSKEEQERNSLGPLGAGQWSGQYPVLPHSLLVLSNFDDWMEDLPRTCRQTIRKARDDKNVSWKASALRAIKPNRAPPQSTFPHFVCVLQHQLRISMVTEEQQNRGEAFFEAVLETMKRFALSIAMTGSILEYHDKDSGELLAFFHIIAKGSTLRGQWFYSSASGRANLAWFHAIAYLVELGSGTERIKVIDLGPNGTGGDYDAHALLKQRYGFELVNEWPAIADYRGDFWTPINSSKA